MFTCYGITDYSGYNMSTGDFFPPRHLIPPLVYHKICICPIFWFVFPSGRTRLMTVRYWCHLMRKFKRKYSGWGIRHITYTILSIPFIGMLDLFSYLMTGCLLHFLFINIYAMLCSLHKWIATTLLLGIFMNISYYVHCIYVWFNKNSCNKFVWK
jgi:hypothetical protein